MSTIIIASNNEHKIKEYRQIFASDKVLSLADIGYVDDVEETGTTFEQNSLIKAKAISQWLQHKGIQAAVLADDSGLCVDALGGAPGVYSARYAGDHNVIATRRKLFKELKGVGNRNAHFRCVITKYYPDGHYVVGAGNTYGRITHKEYGDKSFGYDCMFYSYDLHKTFGRASMEDKNKVSHRGRAINDLLKNDVK